MITGIQQTSSASSVFCMLEWVLSFIHTPGKGLFTFFHCCSSDQSVKEVHETTHHPQLKLFYCEANQKLIQIWWTSWSESAPDPCSEWWLTDSREHPSPLLLSSILVEYKLERKTKQVFHAVWKVTFVWSVLHLSGYDSDAPDGHAQGQAHCRMEVT